MIETVLIFLGAGLGGVFRYWISDSIDWLLGSVKNMDRWIGFNCRWSDLAP